MKLTHIHTHIQGNLRINRIDFDLAHIVTFGSCVLLQNAVSKNATQFKGNAQHDAQEFLLWLLDRVHEDLNTNPHSRPAIKVNFRGFAGATFY